MRKIVAVGADQEAVDSVGSALKEQLGREHGKQFRKEGE